MRFSPPPDSGWRAWYHTHASNLLLYARQWLPCRADAEDSVQAGFVKFWRAKPSPDTADLPLLYASVRCAALDLIKMRNRRARREEASQADAATTWWDADTLIEQERASQMQAMMSRLPAEQREVLVMRIWGGLSFAEIATALGAPLNTTTSRYRYALSNLKKLLPEECHERIGP